MNAMKRNSKPSFFTNREPWMLRMGVEEQAEQALGAFLLRLMTRVINKPGWHHEVYAFVPRIYPGDESFFHLVSL